MEEQESFLNLRRCSCLADTENGLNMIGAQVGIQRVVIGVIVVAAVLLDVVVRNGQFGKTQKKITLYFYRKMKSTTEYGNE